jgi:hypothetical protein
MINVSKKEIICRIYFRILIDGTKIINANYIFFK